MKINPKKKLKEYEKSLTLNVGDFFHVQVIQTGTNEKTREPDVMDIKLKVLDGPYKGYWMYFDSRLNPNLRK